MRIVRFSIFFAIVQCFLVATGGAALAQDVSANAYETIKNFKGRWTGYALLDGFNYCYPDCAGEINPVSLSDALQSLTISLKPKKVRGFLYGYKAKLKTKSLLTGGKMTVTGTWFSSSNIMTFTKTFTRKNVTGANGVMCPKVNYTETVRVGPLEYGVMTFEQKIYRSCATFNDGADWYHQRDGDFIR